MPEPKDGESEQDFVARCIPIVMKEGATQDQASGKCFGIFRNAHKALGTVDTMAEAGKEAPPCAGVKKMVRVVKAVQHSVLMIASLRIAKSEKIDPAELYSGTLEEMEHTSDWREAMQIALDHLNEVADYYTKLAEAGLMTAKSPAEKKD